jgi:hypothetical protein
MNRKKSTSIVCSLIALLLLLSAVLVRAQIYENPYAGVNLQQAIDSAPDGAVIYLGEGDFVGGVMIRKSITLVGVSSAATRIRGRDVGEAVISIWEPEDDEQDIVVRLEQLSIVDALGTEPYSENVTAFGLHIHGNGNVAVQVEQCCLIGNAVNGIEANGALELTIQGTTIAGGRHGIGAGGDIQLLVDSCDVSSLDNSLGLWGSVSAVVRDSTFASQEHLGVWVADSCNVTFENCRLEAPLALALAIESCLENWRSFTGGIFGSGNSVLGRMCPPFPSPEGEPWPSGFLSD